MKAVLCLLLTVSSLFSAEYSFMYWNMENLFDLQDDPVTRDEDYTPYSHKRFNYRAYELKMEHAAQVINYVSPQMLAMVEVENRRVLEDLATRMKFNRDWKIIIEDGPDLRGIDPAFMYNSRYFECTQLRYYPVFFEEENYHSRSIMHVDLLCYASDKIISIFIDHWPSRRGGKAKSDLRRLYAARCLSDAVKEYADSHPESIILITGDFNDDFQDSCIQYLIKEQKMAYLEKQCSKGIKGSYCYHGEWISFDHFLTYPSSGKKYFHDISIVSPHWMRDKETQGPFRFYEGQKISGGYSDHFPIALTIDP